MNLQKENTSMDGKKAYEILSKFLTVKFASLFYNSKTEEENPKISKLRGKIYVITYGFGNKFGTFKDDLKNSDDVDMSTVFSMESKKESIRNHIKEFQKIKSGHLHLYHTCCAGSSGGCYPYTTARNTNEIVFEFTEKGPVGIVSVDFPGDDLIKAIINSNWK
jgi:uncharacterized protein (DUF779 family)